MLDARNIRLAVYFLPMGHPTVTHSAVVCWASMWLRQYHRPTSSSSSMAHCCAHTSRVASTSRMLRSASLLYKAVPASVSESCVHTQVGGRLLSMQQTQLVRGGNNEQTCGCHCYSGVLAGQKPIYSPNPGICLTAVLLISASWSLASCCITGSSTSTQSP